MDGRRIPSSRSIRPPSTRSYYPTRLAEIHSIRHTNQIYCQRHRRITPWENHWTAKRCQPGPFGGTIAHVSTHHWRRHYFLPQSS